MTQTQDEKLIEKSDKASGLGGISPKLENRMVQKAVNEGHVPKEWTEAYINYINIQKRRCTWGDYRGEKLSGQVIKSKLEDEIED